MVIELSSSWLSGGSGQLVTETSELKPGISGDLGLSLLMSCCSISSLAIFLVPLNLFMFPTQIMSVQFVKWIKFLLANCTFHLRAPSFFAIATRMRINLFVRFIRTPHPPAMGMRINFFPHGSKVTWWVVHEREREDTPEMFKEWLVMDVGVASLVASDRSPKESYGNESIPIEFCKTSGDGLNLSARISLHSAVDSDALTTYQSLCIVFYQRRLLLYFPSHTSSKNGNHKIKLAVKRKYIVYQ